MTNMEAETAEDSSKKDIFALNRVVDPTLLKTFWPLAEGNEQERVDAATKLVKRLSDNSPQDAEKEKLERTYILKRLVRGLGSSRAFARVGYSTALSKVLKEVTDIKIKTVLSIIAEELKVSGGDQKAEASNKLLGKAFAYGAVVQSGRIVKLKGEQLSDMFQAVLAVGQEKTHMQAICARTLLDMIAAVPAEKFEAAMWPALREDLDKGWEDCTPTRLLLLLAVKGKDKSPVDQAYLKTHWGASKIFGKANFDSLLHLLMKTVEFPQIQPMMFEAIVKNVAGKDNNVEKLREFWVKIGSPMFATTVARKKLALSLFCRMLQHMPDPRLADAILFPSVASAFLYSENNKNDQLAEVCGRVKSLVTAACEVKAEDEEGGAAVLSIVTKFVRMCLRSKNSTFLRTPFLISLIGKLKGEAVQEFSKAVIDCFHGTGAFLEEADENGDEDDEKVPMCQTIIYQLLVPHLSVIVTGPSSIDDPQVVSTLQFLVLHSFFNVIKPTKDIPHCDKASPSLSPNLRRVMNDTLNKLLLKMLSVTSERSSEKKNQHLISYLEGVSTMARHTYKLITNEKAIEPVKPLSEEIQQEWKKIAGIIGKKKKDKKSTGGKIDANETFNLLLVLLGLDLLRTDGASLDLLQDIHICRQKANSKAETKSSSDADEPEWIEVMTEVLLSVMSKSSKLMRTTCTSVFEALTPHLTVAAVNLIIEVIRPTSAKDKDELFEFDEEQSESDEEENESDDEKKDGDEEMPSDEDGEDDDKDDDETGEVDTKLKSNILAALGSAAVGSDDEDEDDDLDDEEMMKRDKALAKAFSSIKRPTKKEKNEKTKEVVDFKFRAMDMLKVVLRSNRCGDFVVELLEPLLRLIVAKVTGQASQAELDEATRLGKTATELFGIISNNRSMTDSLHSVEEMSQVVSDILLLVTGGSVTDAQLVQLASGCLCVLRLMTAKSSGKGGKAFVKVLQTAMEKDWLEGRSSKIPRTFWATLVRRYPNENWPLTSCIAKALQLQDNSVKMHTKALACSILAEILTVKKRDTLTDKEWSSFLSTTPPLLCKLVLGQTKETFTVQVMSQALSAMYRLTFMSTLEERKKWLTDEVKSHLQGLRNNIMKSEDCKKLFTKIFVRLADYNKKDKKGKKRNKNGEGVTANGGAQKTQGGDHHAEGPSKQKKKKKT